MNIINIIGRILIGTLISEISLISKELKIPKNESL